MTDQELRQLVRDAIARHLHQDVPAASMARADVAHPGPAHPSHGIFPLLRSADGDGACLIEPTVRCNHCGYCLSYGH